MARGGTERLQPVDLGAAAPRVGTNRLFRLTANPVQDQSGHLHYIVVIGVDDTERRLAEIRLFDSSRLANLGEMATGMAHEINQPLAVIRMAADSLLEELDTPEAAAMPTELAKFIKAKLAHISSQTESASGLADRGASRPARFTAAPMSPRRPHGRRLAARTPRASSSISTPPRPWLWRWARRAGCSK